MRIREISEAPVEAASDTADRWTDAGSGMSVTAQGMDLVGGFSGWSGSAADGMRHRVSSSTDRIRVAGSAASLTGDLLGLHCHVLTGFRNAVRLTIGLAEGSGMTVHDDGQVTAGGRGALGFITGVLDKVPGVVGGAVDAAEAAFTATLKAAMIAVRAIDAALAVQISGGTAVESGPAFPDGAPPTEPGEATGQREVVPTPGETTDGVGIDGVKIDGALSERLTPEVRDRVLGSAGDAARELQLRGLDPQETGVTVTEIDGALSVVVGDIDTADKVTTLVSGTGSSAPNGLRDSAALAGRITCPGQATVAWHGYSAPDDLVRAADPASAVTGSRSLRRFQESLRQRNPVARLSVVGHSYGTVVIDKATTSPESPLEADEIHLMGSPGMTARTAGDMNLNSLDGHAEVHVHQADGDPINVIADLGLVHGSDPADPGFGADSVNGRSPDADGGLPGRLWGSLTDAWLIGDRGTGAHSDYRGDEKVLESLRR